MDGTGQSPNRSRTQPDAAKEMRSKRKLVGRTLTEEELAIQEAVKREAESARRSAYDYLERMETAANPKFTHPIMRRKKEEAAKREFQARQPAKELPMVEAEGQRPVDDEMFDLKDERSEPKDERWDPMEE